MPVSQETLMLRALWRKAAKSEEPLRFACATPGAAGQLRLRFYNSVKQVRAGKEADWELEEATSACTLRIDSEDKRVLWLGRRSQIRADETRMLEAALGASMDSLQSTGAEAAEASLARLLADPEGPQVAERPKNPYYERE